jgi:cystathionine beta-synthase
MRTGVLNNILETVGDTPLIRLNRVTEGIDATVLAKVEFFNPGGSVKDRIAVEIVEAAEREGRLKPGGTIVEATSGNTGAGLALVAALKGYKAIFTMPDKISIEKVRNLKALGADVIVTPTAVPPDSPESYYSVARKIVAETPNSILADQYFNPLNPEAHYRSTGPEIWEQTGGRIDCFVAGLGTGGTISGVGKFLKEKNPEIRVIGADPVGSILKQYFYRKEMTEAKPYKVEGVGEDIIPGTLLLEYIDEIIEATDKESFNMARRIAREEGIFIGGSCGLAAHVALRVARELPADKVVVVLFPDSGGKYLSTFYSDDWMQENRLMELGPISVERILARKPEELRGLVSISPEDPVREAIARMQAHHISQLPVIAGDRSVGRVEEGHLMGDVISDGTLMDRPVREVMEESFPVISSDHTIDEAKEFLAGEHAAVLVEEKGRPAGIITKSDLLGFIES